MMCDCDCQGVNKYKNVINLIGKKLKKELYSSALSTFCAKDMTS